jgi:UDP-2-acetamido-3-amino-2,3-dideoxy-glucuronate N-acetyltransferase
MSKPNYFKHPQALVESDQIGEGTRIWAFAHILPGAKIGADCNICDNIFIENDVLIGDRVTIKCGVQLWDGLRIEDDVFVGPNATFSNDPAPRSNQQPAEFSKTVLRRGASIGANATVLPGIIIGQHAMVGAGAVVTRSVPPFAVVVGNPARIVRYTDEFGSRVTTEPRSEVLKLSTPQEVEVGDVTIHDAPIIKDLRGNLSARELGSGMPFAPQRYFVVFDVPSKEVRGAHAHRECAQLLICLKGSVTCVVDDGVRRKEILLDTPERAVHMPPMTWGIQYKYSGNALLLVLASHAYDATDYIRDYDQFLVERNAFVART